MIELNAPAAILLFLAGLLAGGVNALAGGGTLLTFPALLALGLPPVVATASNAVALWPAHASAAFGARRQLFGAPLSRRQWALLCAIEK